MTKADIVNEIAQKTGREKKAVTECVEAFMETVTEELARGGRIELRDFGNFMVKERAAKVGRNSRHWHSRKHRCPKDAGVQTQQVSQRQSSKLN